MATTSWTPNRVRFSHADRQRILRRDPDCMACHNAPSTCADHVIPVAEGGTNDVDNGQGLCQGCHDAKTKREQARGLERQPSRRRPVERHPGLVR